MAVLPVPGLPARRIARPPIWILSLMRRRKGWYDRFKKCWHCNEIKSQLISSCTAPNTHLSLINHSINNSHRLPSLSLTHHPLRPSLARLQSIIETEATNMRVCAYPFEAGHFTDCHAAGGVAGGVVGEFYSAHFVL